MTACLAEVTTAMANRKTVDLVEDIFRNAFYQAMSETRELMFKRKLDEKWRDKLIDSLSENFDPERKASDAFSDAFTSIKEALDEELERRESEYFGIAAE